MDTIVVGVDGSGGSHAALEFAYAEAVRRNAVVKAVSAWQYPYMAVASTPFGGAMAPAIEMQHATEEALDSVLADVPAPSGLTVTRVVREGSAASVLLSEAEGAALLVVGARGHGGFSGLLLGSVATQCVSHVCVPTAVIPVS